MSGPSPEELVEADRWLREAGEELDVASYVLGAPHLPGRVVCFHAHLAAEKALKSLQIRRGVVVRKTHNLLEIAEELPDADQSRFEPGDLDLLNPWTIGGRYPANLEDVDMELGGRVLAATERVLAAVREATAS